MSRALAGPAPPCRYDTQRQGETTDAEGRDKPTGTHQGETREERIVEFHECNPEPVLGLREGAWLHRSGGTLTLGGHTARLFRRDAGRAELAVGTDLSWLLAPP